MEKRYETHPPPADAGGQSADRSEVARDLYSRESLMARPLLQAPDADGNGVPVLIQQCLLNPPRYCFSCKRQEHGLTGTSGRGRICP